ncbi:MAG: hypothetical protein ACRD3P_06500 [Terriglobales bacterium]
MASTSAGNADPLQARAAKAGAQFEAILLNMVFGELQRTLRNCRGPRVMRSVEFDLELQQHVQ